MTQPPPPQPFTLRLEENGTSLLYDRVTHAYTRRTAAEAFLLTASLEVPLPRAVGVLAAEVGQEEADAARTSLEELGAFQDGRFVGRVVELASVPGAYGAPLVAHLGVTLACNYACAHCYSSSGKRAPQELTLPEVERLITSLAEMGCMKLVLGGGEPFLRKELPAIVACAHQHGVDSYVHTNASLVNETVLAALSGCPPAGLSVSVDGPDATTNDVIRGDGTFDKTLAGVARLQAHYPPGFNISVTITPHNASLAGGMVDLAHQLGAHVLLLRPAYPAGEAAQNNHLQCTRDTFARAIDAARARAEQLGVTVDAPHPHEQGVPDFDGFGCVASRIVLGITPQGDVTPCLNLPNAFVSGNLRTTPLADLWRHGNGFSDVRAQSANPQCESCRHFDTCRGGCRVRALFAGNGLSGPDSWCHYEPRVGTSPVTFQPPGAPRLRVMS